MIDFSTHLNRIRDIRAVLKTDLTRDRTQLKTLQEEISELERKKDLYTKCITEIKRINNDLQSDTINKICKIVTSAYQFIFQNNDEFVIETNFSTKIPSAKFYIKTLKGDEHILLDPIEEDGGGKVDVISFGLRIAGILLIKPKLNKVLVLDEQLKFLSASSSGSLYKERAAQFLKKIGEDYGIQIIAVTHDAEYIENTHKKFTVSLDNEGFSTISEEVS